MSSFWGEFAVLYAGALIGAAALTPYVRRLIEASRKPSKLPTRLLLLISLAQNAVLFAAVVALGLLAARAVGRGAPLVETALRGAPTPTAATLTGLGVGAGAGVVAGLVLLVADFWWLPRLPELLALTRRTTLRENFLACFYGGVNEELLMRLLGVSGAAWLLSGAWRGAPPPGDLAAWSAILAMAVLFGLGHLPATRAVLGRLSVSAVTRSLLLNGVVGVLCGRLFWVFGIEAAALAHFLVDLVYHVGGTALLRALDGRPTRVAMPLRLSR